MGFSFLGSAPLNPVVRINPGALGGLLSLGGRGAHVMVRSNHARTLAGVPGSGLWSTKRGETSHQIAAAPPGEAQLVAVVEAFPTPSAARSRLWVTLLATIIAVFSVRWAYASEVQEVVPSEFAIYSPVPDTRGTERQPIVVQKSADAIRDEEIERAEHAHNESVTTWSTVILAMFTVLLWGANIWLIRDARRVSDRQAVDTRNALKEQTRAADAMRDVAEATRTNAALMSGMIAKQMRAYIQVNTGTSTAQRGENTNFGSWPEILNAGLTPAKKVSYRIMADILDAKLVGPDFKYPEPPQVFTNDATLNPRQSFTILGAVDRRFEQADIDLISKGEDRRLFVWGTVTYQDVFDSTVRETRFSHNFVFFDQTNAETGKTEHKVNSFFSRGHNDAT